MSLLSLVLDGRRRTLRQIALVCKALRRLASVRNQKQTALPTEAALRIKFAVEAVSVIPAESLAVLLVRQVSHAAPQGRID
ncbi:hypothetical protein JQ616_21230 [Bradyrhizobium tropiciagri]|uniref:hypothetical protein n=1 Tax=Bradyrhizobium tropiciagri TaxID=312253 RepID=UPI001BA85A11|nr:hypothetical protein [Bradyrhizobium tropiciagri]MBR0897486.1 hypothetical protein [Bradyrhizobium tropiciagri]